MTGQLQFLNKGNGTTHLVIEEMDGMLVEPERQSLQERNVVSHDFFIGEIEFVHDDRIDMIIRQQVI